MLDLHDILWVIPGVIFIYFYNRRRPNDTINLSGWPYIFFLVVIAVFTWLPIEFFYKANFFNIKAFFDDFEIIENYFIEDVFILLFSVIFSIILFFITQNKMVAKWMFPSVQDNFYKKCVEWEHKGIILTLKNGKAYYGILWKYPENSKSRHESQTISIVPCISGFRDEKTKKVKWSTYYPEYENEENFLNSEIIIPRSEIITFGKFNREIFEDLYEDYNDLTRVNP